jgi:hypothetical protein
MTSDGIKICLLIRYFLSVTRQTPGLAVGAVVFALPTSPFEASSGRDRRKAERKPGSRQPGPQAHLFERPRTLHRSVGTGARHFLGPDNVANRRLQPQRERKAPRRDRWLHREIPIPAARLLAPRSAPALFLPLALSLPGPGLTFQHLAHGSWHCAASPLQDPSPPPHTILSLSPLVAFCRSATAAMDRVCHPAACTTQGTCIPVMMWRKH